jgi:hypothetical protein
MYTATPSSKTKTPVHVIEILYVLLLEYVPCPLVEIKNGRKRILEQPVDLTNLTATMADAAVNFIDQKAGTENYRCLLLANIFLTSLILWFCFS